MNIEHVILLSWFRKTNAMSKTARRCARGRAIVQCPAILPWLCFFASVDGRTFPSGLAAAHAAVLPPTMRNVSRYNARGRTAREMALAANAEPVDQRLVPLFVLALEIIEQLRRWDTSLSSPRRE